MNWINWITYASIAANILGAAYTIWFRLKHGVAHEETELYHVIKESRDEYRIRADNFKKELDNYRETAHTAANTANAQILTLTAENARLSNQTDLTPIIKFIQEQTKINTKVLETLDAIMSRIEKLQPAKKIIAELQKKKRKQQIKTKP